MAYNSDVAHLVRSTLSGREVREVAMFGGLAFMLDQRMVVCVSGGGGDLLVRVAPERDAELVTRPGARRAQMGKGRTMGAGWIAVDDAVLESDEELRFWMDAALDFHAAGSGGRKRRGT
ncbi:MAG: TfoX/Sxy family protein [Actinomycetales bacterium]